MNKLFLLILLSFQVPAHGAYLGPLVDPNSAVGMSKKNQKLLNSGTVDQSQDASAATEAGVSDECEECKLRKAAQVRLNDPTLGTKPEGSDTRESTSPPPPAQSPATSQ